MKDLDLHFDVINLAPLRLDGCCGDTHFLILEDEGGFRLIGSDGLESRHLTLKDALQDSYLTWG